MTPQALRNSILQRAIEGKLVEQREDEGTVDQLLLHSTVKKRNNIESLFDIPSNWEWMNLEDLCNLIGGYAFKSTQYRNKGVRIIRISDFNEDGLLDINKKYYEEEKALNKYLIESNDILMCMTGGTVGKTTFLGEIKEKLYLNQRVVAIRVREKFIIDKRYLYYVITSEHIKSIINTQKNSTNDNISMGLIQQFPIPVPPLPEQQRIVEKIEELMPFVEAYERDWQKLEDLNRTFPEEMKKSILQEAIRGRLVEQREEEGTGQELLAEIYDEVKSFIELNRVNKNNKYMVTEENEDDFEVPDNWGKVRLGEICFILNGKKENKKTYPYLEVKYLRGTIEPKMKTSGRVVNADTNVILMDGENSGEVFKTRETGYLGSTLKILYFPKLINEKFYLYFLFLNKKFLRDNKRGAAIPHLDKEVFFNLIFPLPPLAEQERIVERIEELLPLCDALGDLQK